MSQDSLFVKSIGKAQRVLDTFDGASHDLSLGEISQRSGLDKSATQRFAHSLEVLGYLERNPNTKRLALGKRSLDLAFRFLRSHPLVRAATPTLVELRRDCNESVSLGLFDGTSLVYAIRQQGMRKYFDSSLIGLRMPTFCTSGGRATLACLPEEEMREIIACSELTRWTPATIVEPEALFVEIEKARAQGYALAASEFVVGEITMGAAIVDADGYPLAAIHIAGSLDDWTPEAFARRFASSLMAAARSLSHGAK